VVTEMRVSLAERGHGEDHGPAVSSVTSFGDRGGYRRSPDIAA